MTSTELAAALRERFLKLHAGFPKMCKATRRASDDQIITGNLRCGACRMTHTPKHVALELAAKHATLEPWLQGMQELALQTWPPPCLAALRAFIDKMAAERLQRNL